MAVSREFLEFLKDQLSDFGPITARRMFGGAGIYRDGVMFALIAGDMLYFKADELTIAAFEAERSGPFVYQTSKGPNTIRSYWRAPEQCMDDPQEMVAWARKAFEAARRNRQA